MPKNEGQKPASVGAYLFAELRHAFQDIRQKVVEEGWFGRVVTAAPVIEADAALGTNSAHEMERRAVYGDDGSPLHPRSNPEWRNPSFEERWAARDEPAAPEHGIDIDR
jgi:hypothetical protein